MSRTFDFLLASTLGVYEQDLREQIAAELRQVAYDSDTPVGERFPPYYAAFIDAARQVERLDQR